MAHEEIRQALRNWRDERDSAAVYEALAAAERNPRLERVFRKLAAAEHEHSVYWEGRLQAMGRSAPAYRPSLRARILSALARRFGVAFVAPSITARELADRDRYRSAGGLAALSVEERGHAAVMRMVGSGRHAAADGQAAPVAAGTLDGAMGNKLRAAVLGATDGLASNFCLLMGVAGGGATANTILLTGIAGLVAGACSMALGEWLSVTNARELARSQIDRDLEEMRAAPDWARQELALVFETRGMEEDEALRAADRVIGEGRGAVDALLRAELAIDPTQLGADPVGAAGYSLALFALGACIPLLPFFLPWALAAAIACSIGLSLLALFALGLLTSFFNARPLLYSGLRQLAVGAGAAMVTYAAGRLAGAALG